MTQDSNDNSQSQSLTNIWSALQNGVAAVNSLVQTLNKVTITSTSGSLVIRVTGVSS